MSTFIKKTVNEKITLLKASLDINFKCYPLTIII